MAAEILILIFLVQGTRKTGKIMVEHKSFRGCFAYCD